MSSEAKLSSVIGAVNYRVVNTASGNELIGDEPLEKGGGHTGLNPLELMLASLGTCTCATLRMYAQRKGWNTGDIRSDLNAFTDKGQTKISRVISYSEPLSEEQKQRLLHIADRCPMHVLLSGTIAIETR